MKLTRRLFIKEAGLSLAATYLSGCGYSIPTITPTNTIIPTKSLTNPPTATQIPAKTPTLTPTVTFTPTKIPSSTPALTPKPIPRPTATFTPTIESRIIRAEGTKLFLGNNEFRFIGVNRYNTAGDKKGFWCGGTEELEIILSKLEELKGPTNKNMALRFWAFQSYSFSQIDRVFKGAEKHGIYLIPVLENHWKACTQPNYHKNSEWYSEGFKHPYGNYKLSYVDYIKEFVNRYKKESIILMWQLMNEAEANDAQALYNFAVDMSAYIKSIDNNHVVSLGTIGGNQYGVVGDNYKRLHSIRTIDIVESHDYDYHSAMPGYPDSTANTIWSNLKDAKELNKPFFIGEAGIEAGFNKKISLEQRVELFDKKINAVFANGCVGYLIWHYCNKSEFPYDFDPQDPLFDYLKNLKI